MRIDQSTKIAATTFLRCLDEAFSSTDKLLELFYDVQDIKVEKLKPEHYSAEMIIDSETGRGALPRRRPDRRRDRGDPGLRAQDHPGDRQRRPIR